MKSEVPALTERKAAATRFDGNKFLMKEERDKLETWLDKQLFDFMYLYSDFLAPDFARFLYREAASSCVPILNCMLLLHRLRVTE